MRVLGLDLGAARIGVAVTDPLGVIASPYQVVHRSGDHRADHRRIAELVAEVGAERVVVGLPRSLSGREGPAARAVRAEVAELAGALTVPVEWVDERFTTVSAERALRQGGVRGRRRRQVVDAVAAAVLLQSWLDGTATSR